MDSYESKIRPFRSIIKSNNEYLIGSTYIKVFYKNDLVCQGLITSNKEIGICLLSCDNKFYFNPSCSDIRIEKSDTSLDYFNTFTDDKCSPYNLKLLETPEVIQTIPCFREHDISELDPEIEHIVKSLNKINGCVTQTSCSGHNKIYPYVECTFNTITALQTLVTYISSSEELLKNVVVKTCHWAAQLNEGVVGVKLVVEFQKKGKPGWELTETLATIIDCCYMT